LLQALRGKSRDVQHVLQVYRERKCHYRNLQRQRRPDGQHCRLSCQ
jgi:hypothetical protein